MEKKSNVEIRASAYYLPIPHVKGEGKKTIGKGSRSWLKQGLKVGSSTSLPAAKSDTSVFQTAKLRRGASIYRELSTSFVKSWELGHSFPRLHN